jgi:hypothetical protein
VPTPVTVPVVQSPVPTTIVPKAVKPTQPPKIAVDDIDRSVTPQELQEADEYLKLGQGYKPGKDVDTARGVRELREAILQGRVNATEQRKRELGFLPESKVRATIPKKEMKIKTKYTKEQHEKYLETARRLDEQKKKRLADAINDVMKETE